MRFVLGQTVDSRPPVRVKPGYYRKTDVQTHSDGYGRPPHPAVNVKVYANFRDVKLPEGWQDPAYTHDWIEEHVKEEEFQSYWDGVCEQGWEMIQEDAEEIFGAHVKVYSEGRSGGWAVVHGLPVIEYWDAIMLARWRKFERWLKSGAARIPGMVAEDIYLNIFMDPERQGC